MAESWLRKQQRGIMAESWLQKQQGGIMAESWLRKQQGGIMAESWLRKQKGLPGRPLARIEGTPPSGFRCARNQALFRAYNLIKVLLAIAESVTGFEKRQGSGKPKNRPCRKNYHGV